MIEKGESAEKQLRGHQFIRISIYHPSFPLSNTQHDLDLHLQEQLKVMDKTRTNKFWTIHLVMYFYEEKLILLI